MAEKKLVKKKKKKVAEQQFLDILQKIKDEGAWRTEKQISKKTGQPTKAKTLAGMQLRFKPEDGMPLTTLRNMKKALYYFIAEALWLLSGDTGVELLHKYDVHYWDEWCDAEHCGWYNLPVGQFGRTYGAQWRSFNAGGPEPVDQFKRLFDRIAQNPYDRSLIVTAWNPYDVDHLVVKPCHGQFQLILLDNKWTMIVVQRSSDFPIGFPADVVLYKFLQMLICMKTGFGEGELVYNLHDVHYRDEQQEGVDEVLSRKPRAYPKVTLDPIFVKVLDKLMEGEKDPLRLPEFNPDQKPYIELIQSWVKIEGYKPHPALPKDMLPIAV